MRDENQRDGGTATEESAAAGSLLPEDLAAHLRARNPLSVLDVRDRDEFDRWHIEGDAVTAKQVPHVRFLQAEVKGGLDDLVADLTEPILVVCGRGKASARIADDLVAAGYDAVNLTGGMEAWARVFLAEPVPADADGATVVQFHRPSSGCVSYLVAADGAAVVVDPLRAFTDRYRAAANRVDATVTHALDTHVHADHVSGVRSLSAESDVTGRLPVGARARGLADEVATIADGETLAVGNATLRAIATPGHTSEHLAYQVGDVLLTGDALFLDGVGRPDLEAGDDGAAEMAETLYATLHDRILARDDDTRIAPGHYADVGVVSEGSYTARLGALRERLSALSLSEAAFVDRVVSSLGTRPANYERIIDVNLGRESVDAETAFEMELGPNNCAAVRE